jgi:Tfp pilus assembly protein PilV
MFQKRISPFSKFSYGLTLLEVIIAITVLTIGTVGISFFISYTIAFSRIPYQKLIAAYLAQEGIEIVRNIRDTNWVEGDPWDSDLACCGAFPCDCEGDYTTQILTDTYDGDFLYIDMDDTDGDGTTNVYRYIDTPGPNDIKTAFKRKISISQSQTDILEVTVVVQWKEKGKSYQIEAKENLYNWH